MKYLLLIMIVSGGVHTVPDTYPNKEACESVAQLVESSYSQLQSNGVVVQCIPKFEE